MKDMPYFMIHGGNNMEWNSVRELMTEFSETNRYRLIHGEGEYSFGEFIDEYFRIDTEDGALISEGWVFGEGDAYFRHEASAEEYCQKRYGCSVSELYEDEGSEVYWTEWYEKNQEG